MTLHTDGECAVDGSLCNHEHYKNPLHDLKGSSHREMALQVDGEYAVDAQGRACNNRRTLFWCDIEHFSNRFLKEPSTARFPPV